MRFQVLFHSPPGVLFTFPSRYLSTIGRQEYLALDGGPPGFPHERPSTWYSGNTAGSRIAFAYGAITLSGWPFHATFANDPICNSLRVRSSRRPALQHRDCNGCDLSRSHGLGFSAFARHYSRNVLFSSRYLDVSVPSVSPTDLCIQSAVPRHYPGWVSPFGYLRVITLARSSPKHFVACHVLLRLLAPRHPPHALSSLT